MIASLPRLSARADLSAHARHLWGVVRTLRDAPVLALYAVALKCIDTALSGGRSTHDMCRVLIQADRALRTLSDHPLMRDILRLPNYATNLQVLTDEIKTLAADACYADVRERDVDRPVALGRDVA